MGFKYPEPSRFSAKTTAPDKNLTKYGCGPEYLAQRNDVDNPQKLTIGAKRGKRLEFEGACPKARSFVHHTLKTPPSVARSI
jgi:hypothetical protein